MPTFDVVSEVDMQEVRNAVDQANREIATRFDFKGSDARVEQAEAKLTIHADDEFKVNQARDILEAKLAKRKVDLGCLERGKIQTAASGKAQQEITVRHGLDAELAKRIARTIKDGKLKVQAAIQGPQVRVSGKKRDDLQEAIALLRRQNFGLPLQYTNFRD